MSTTLLIASLTLWAFLRVQGELCESNICLNGGTCFVSASKESFCICPDGFAGTDCNMTEKGPCQPNPCHNNGECQELSHTRRGDTFAQYSCKCLPGYFGENCENSCASALGMEGGSISDAQITASSLYHGFLGLQRWGPNLARLNNKGLVNAWTANSYDKHPWIQVNLLRQMRVSGIITQGASRMGKAEYLKEFKVGYSVDGQEFTFYKVDGQIKDKIFSGNLDNEGRKANILSPPVTAQYIRIYPVTCHRACTLRFELFGCEMSGCSDALGLKSHMISDKQITASSVFKTWGIDAFTWHPHYARLDKIGKTNAWTASENNQSEWLQIDLGVPKKITGIITQGAKDFGNIQYVEAFKIAYSDTGSTWMVYQDSRTKTDKVFLGNSDNYTHKKNLFSPPFSARYVRILPQAWHERITLRMELLGCDN
ncbi:hypothetical protein GDO78_005242 [Eleutherodactylus coqui]|uniref:Milk fat globule-EGF factor 8 protein n=1 Tax=Eleutherodactylus coqui TaxID=57060 RepID=A0A8J6KED3_ELECQ|nr:hypothetical protein GDO78_005242 [Eleutherodactylus coqui]